MSFTKTIHISELNHQRLEIEKIVNDDKTLEITLNKILNEKFIEEK